jgi:hypothetical protein
MTNERNIALHMPIGSLHQVHRSQFGQRLSGVLCLLVLFAGPALAQDPGSSAAPSPEEGISRSGYRIHQSVEVGYRYSDQNGSEAMYDTLVNLQTGPRLLEQTLSMQSENHQGTLFDDLYVSSFGWGGDPNNALRARIGKYRWYDFRASFRRDQNFFDFNLLANPLNPPTSSPNVPILDSPHSFQTRRRMSDVDITLLPQSAITFRVGYSRNNMTGPSWSSFHEGTDVSLSQPWNTTMDSYRFGVDVKFLPRTTLSYDQVFDYYKGDTSWQLFPSTTALLPGGGSVTLGLPFDTTNRIPCGIPTGQTSLIDLTGTLTNLACNGYFNYNRNQRVRTSTPTERLSMRSNFFSWLDLAGSYAYSSAEMTTPLNESFNGLVTRTFTRQFSITGPAEARRISNVADFSATIHLGHRFRLVDNFYFWGYRIPSSFAFTEAANVIPDLATCTPPACSLLTPLSNTTETTTDTLDQFSFNQSWKRNQIELLWDVSKRFGARIGYRYGSRELTHVLDFAAGDVDDVVIHEHTMLFGVWARPTPALRANFDLEHTNNDNYLVRIGPRREWRYRFKTNYSPRPWAVLGASFNILQNSNNDIQINYSGHNRNFGFDASLTPRERLAFDAAYNYSGYKQNALICFNDTPPVGVVLPVVAAAGACADDPANPLLTDGYYESTTHFGMGTVMLKPVKRVTTRVGYSITSVDGKTPQFNILQPLGSLAYNYHQPVASVMVDLGHNLSWNAGWNYYQYGEKSFVGPTAPRYFHANTATISMRWAF